MGAESISIELEIEEYIGGGGSGTNNYNQLSNKPQINGVILEGNKTLAELGINNEVDNELSKTSTNPVQNAVITEALEKKSSVDSPEFTGVPKVPTAIQGTKTAQAASTEFVMGAVETKADKTEIPIVPKTLPNPQPVTFGGIIPEVSYDGSQAVNIMFPAAEMMDEVMGTPVGEIISYMGNTAPKHYLICDGTVYNVADYPELAQHFATEFGTSNYFGGDGETTFAVPDLRGEFLRGTGTNGHANNGSGANVGVHQDATRFMPVEMNATSNLWAAGNGAGFGNTLNPDTITTGSGFRQINSSLQGSGSSTTLISSRPTNTSVLYCIKYKSTHFIRVGGGNYSLEERRIGTWIDGKPLYEKTVDFGKLPNATTKEVPHGIENIDTIWVYDGWVNNLNYSNILQTTWSNVNNSFNFYVDKINITCYSVNNRSEQSGFVTIRYTKTTD